MPVARALEALHRGHPSEIAGCLRAMGEQTDDGTPRGTVNKIATTLRAWTLRLDADALSFLRTGEELLLKNDEAALDGWNTATAGADRQIVARHAQKFRDRIASLPKA